MRLGIDASNLRGGGGLTHLVELLESVKPNEHGFEQVSVWGGRSTLESLVDRQWLLKVREPLLDCSLPSRLFWQRFVLGHRARSVGCDVLFIPGGFYPGTFKPFVTMCRNMLPFKWQESRRYGISWMSLKFVLLRVGQLNTFKEADGLIFLSGYAKSSVSKILRGNEGVVQQIPHGVDRRFFREPRPQRPISDYSEESPYRLLYISPIAPYKHQWCVIEAVWKLRQLGVPAALELIGPAYHSKQRLFAALDRYDPDRVWVNYRGGVGFDEIHAAYHRADMFVYASSCENLPNILLEAMASGLPIACSNRGPMPEVLDDAGVYFDPEKPVEIAGALRALLEDPALRKQKAQGAYERAQSFSWERCARETFDFLAQVARQAAI